MSWDFATDAEFAAKLAWAREFLDSQILPLEPIEYDVSEADWQQLTQPLKDEVKRQRLWACHLGPELGGQGYGQVKLALLHEILGRSTIAPSMFGSQAPDSGNAELLAIAGTEDQKQRWLFPLLNGELHSSFSMTEPAVAGSDPTLLCTSARFDGDTIVVDGHKWFSSHASIADFLLVVAVTDPDADPHRRCSIVIVPTDTPGVHVVRDIPTMHHPYPINAARRPAGHAEVLYGSARVPAANLLGNRGDGFRLAQQRLGPGRLHHVMRWIGQARRAYDMMCERAVSRHAHGSLLSDKQLVQQFVSLSYNQIEAATLLCMKAAWTMDQQGSSHARAEIASAKVFGAQMLHDVIDRAIQVHGALGYSADLPLEEMLRRSRAARLVDGADEVHHITIARRELRRHHPVSTWPTEHIPTRAAASRDRYAAHLAGPPS
jgi:acyl-CoA dehydrogenase